MGPYAEAAAEYLEAGFGPIPARGKRTIKNQHHGRGKPMVTADEVARWSRLHPEANIAARLPRDIIGIDVDAYAGKPGKTTLEELEDELGELPATLVSTSRHDGVSGIRLFRIPERYWSVIWPGKAGPGIEIIWHGNRYMIVWPSVHPDTQGMYLWYDQDEEGEFLTREDGIPDFDELPDFPRNWCDHFARIAHEDEQIDVSDTADWTKEHGGGEMCSQMERNVERALESFPANAHDTARDATLGITKDAAYGHPGMSKAMSLVLEAFLEEMAGRSAARRSRAKQEWQRHLRGAVRRAAALMKNGRPSVDPCRELDGIDNASPIRVGLVKPVSSLSHEKVRWLWPGYLAFRELTQMDGEKGQGKTFVTDDVAARATLGRAMPGQPESVCEPVRVLILTDEGHANSTIYPRLLASGADLDMVFIPDEIKVKRGRAPDLFLLPESAERIGEMIRACNAGLVIWDPITDFLGERIDAHNDASVRRALRPMAIELAKHMCSGWALRHMNKQKSAEAKHRGSGTSAFQNRARVHLVIGSLPKDYSGQGDFGLAQVDSNLMRRREGSLLYSIVDSDVESDEQGNMVGKVQWHDFDDSISANKLTQSESSHHGPEPVAQERVREILEDLFVQKDTWPQSRVIEALRLARASTTQSVVDKVCKGMGIRRWPIQKRGSGGGFAHWIWTTNQKQRPYGDE